MNKKWINSALIVRHIPLLKVCLPTTKLSLMIHLSRRRNTTQTTKTTHYDWSSLNTRDVCDKYTIKLRNKFEDLQENHEY